jgi:hypothetical protein
MTNQPRDSRGRFLPANKSQTFTGFEGTTGVFSPTPSASLPPSDSLSTMGTAPPNFEPEHPSGENPDDFQDASDIEQDLNNLEPETNQSPTPVPLPAISRDDLFFDQLMQTFASAISTTHTGQQAVGESRGSKMPSPDKFNGDHPEKLRTFFLQGELHFRDRPRDFPNDAKKVTYMIAHLEGTALDWFEPHLSTPIPGYEPTWLNSYAAFQQELRLNFGPLHPTEEAEAALEALAMKDNQRIQPYMVQFNRWASLAQWGERALARRFYAGLPNRLKDALYNLPGGKPTSLAELRLQAMTLDARYWERKAELLPITPLSGPVPKPNHSLVSAHLKASPKTATKTPTSQPTPARSIPGVGTDGKLTAEERQRRIANNLCLFCGIAGHMVKDCRKRASAMNARAAKVDETSEDGNEAEPAKQ